MSRARSSLLLLGIAVAAMLIGAVRLVTQEAQLPTGSSYSAQPDGALALYQWIGDAGARTQQRLSDTTIDPAVQTVLIIQPAGAIDQSTRDALDVVADRGGTLVLAGDSVQWLIFARALGVTVEPASAAVATATTPDGLRLPLPSRYRLRGGQQAEPLLVRDNGDWVGARIPYHRGSLVVIASPEPFTNAGLADDATARFVFRDVISPAIASGQAGQVAFDEIERPSGPSDSGTPGLEQLVFQTPAGRAVLYAGVVVFVFLVLAGRRLGPPLYLPSAAEAPRTMYEHVQMLANLYRRAGQLGVVRETVSRHCARALARGTLPPARAAVLTQALARVESARGEAELVAAVASLEDTRAHFDKTRREDHV